MGCRQLGNDNHIRLSQTLQAPPPRKGTLICHSSITDVGGGGGGHHSQGNETAENNFCFSFFGVSKG